MKDTSSPLITAIERSSVHDGPGFRTVVFFKGCPLRCEWCHNPECISFEKETLYYPEKCIGCGRCDEGCFSGAKAVCGKEYSPQELLSELLTDKPYFGSDGGVTLSGGEPMMHREFLRELIPLLEKERIKVALETSLYLYDEAILKRMQVIMADVKIWYDSLHRKYCGAENGGIKENFLKLSRLGVPIIIRTPVIPEIDQGLSEISAFARSLPNVIKYELLPYHLLGEPKKKALGLEPSRFSVPSNEYIKELNEKYAFKL